MMMLEKIRTAIKNAALLDDVDICCLSDLSSGSCLEEINKGEVSRYVDGGRLDELSFALFVRLPFDRTAKKSSENYRYICSLANSVSALAGGIGAEQIDVIENCTLVQAQSAFAVYRCCFRAVCLSK